MKRKVIAIVIALALVFTLSMPMSAFATPEEGYTYVVDYAKSQLVYNPEDSEAEEPYAVVDAPMVEFDGIWLTGGSAESLEDINVVSATTSSGRSGTKISIGKDILDTLPIGANGFYLMFWNFDPENYGPVIDDYIRFNVTITNSSQPPQAVSIKTQPKTAYTEGDALDLSGLVATLSYDDSTSEDVPFASFAAKGIATSLAHSTKLTTAHHGQKVTLTATAGTASFTTQTAALSVVAKPIPPASIAGATVIAVPDKAYTGSQIKPALTVKYAGKLLKLGTDYTVAYGTNKAIGKGTATITGKGAYDGTKTVSFKINPTKLIISKLTTGKKQVKVAWKAAPKAQGITKYQIRYALKGKTAWKTVNVPSKKLNVVIKKLKTGKAYQFQIRSYKTVSGANYYAPWSATKTSARVK
ncbi:MAG: fibronectin type III domain-containing protein [Candidatus Nomurabacteria bacterium]|nr:fibronectin type III domain-containing protein [Candidatus Nomurabacteria bacterium]